MSDENQKSQPSVLMVELSELVQPSMLTLKAKQVAIFDWSNN